MTETQVQGICLAAVLAALPLISWGTVSEIAVAWVVGAVLFVAGSVTLTALRFIDLGDAT